MKILITGGIGDFIAIESHISKEDKKKIKHISLGCFHNLEIKLILEKCKSCFPSLEKIDFFFSEFVYDPIKKFPTPPDLEKNIKEQKKMGLLDFSMSATFEKIINKELDFCGSCLFKNKISETGHLNLPKRYYVVFPHSLKAVLKRQFSQKDWKETLRILEYRDMRGVVITQSDLPIPDNKRLIVLKNQTNILEAIEIVKNSDGFIGVDTFAATLSAQMSIYLKIKSINKRTYEWKKNIYFAPRKEFSFLSEEIICPKSMI